MAQFKLELGPIKLLGYDRIPDEKKKFFDVTLRALAEFMKFVEGVTNVTITNDHSLLINGSDDIEEKLATLNDKAIITKVA